MGLTVNAFEFLKPEPAEVYQEAALSLRYKRITAITAAKLQRAIKLLQLEPHHLVMRGLASRRSLVKGLDWSGKQQGRQKTFLVPANFGNSVTTEAFPPQRDQNGKIEEKNDDQNDGWSDYEDNYDSDSDIDDDEDKDDEIEGRRKGPIYDFLVYGGVQLRPDEYVLLFRALGVSLEYVEQLQKPHKITSCSSHDSIYRRTHLGDAMIERKASQYHGSSSRGRDELDICFSERYPDQGGASLRSKPYGRSCSHISHRYTPNIYHRFSTRSHASAACSPQTSRDLLQQKNPTRQPLNERPLGRLRKMAAGDSVHMYRCTPVLELSAVA